MNMVAKPTFSTGSKMLKRALNHNQIALIAVLNSGYA
jgi:hypothetical protein